MRRAQRETDIARGAEQSSLDRLLGVFGAAVLGVAACLILRTPRWLVWRVSGCTSRPTLNQLADVKPAHVIAVRVLGVVTALFAVGFAAAALVG